MTVKILLEELKSLESQRQDAVETLLRIDGAVSMVHHLLGRITQQEKQTRAEAEVKPEAN